MRDSNNFHSVCLDSYPPISYMNEASFELVELVHEVNDWLGKNIFAYTFDAGPNCHLLVRKKEQNICLYLISKILEKQKKTIE